MLHKKLSRYKRKRKRGGITFFSAFKFLDWLIETDENILFEKWPGMTNHRPILTHLFFWFSIFHFLWFFFSDKKEMRELVVFIPILIDIIYSSFIHSHAHVSMSLGFIAIMTLLLLYIRFVFLFEYCGDDLI